MNLPLSSRFLAFPHRSSGDFFGVWARGELAAPEGWSHRVPAAGASPSHGATRSTQPGSTEDTEPSPCATPSPELAGLVLNPALPAGGGCKNGICVGCDEEEHHHEAQHHLVDEHHSKDEHHPEAPSITPRPSTPPRCCGSQGLAEEAQPRPRLSAGPPGVLHTPDLRVPFEALPAAGPSCLPRRR